MAPQPSPNGNCSVRPQAVYRIPAEAVWRTWAGEGFIPPVERLLLSDACLESGSLLPCCYLQGMGPKRLGSGLWASDACVEPVGHADLTRFMPA